MDKKKIVMLALVMFVTFGLLSTFKYGYEYYKDNNSVMSSLATEVTTIDEMRDIIDNQDVVYVYMGRPNCGDSDEFEEYFPDLMKDYDVDVLYYFNIKDISDEYSSNSEYKEILFNEFGLTYTPTLAKYENGELVILSQWTPSNGYSKEMAIQFLKESGYSD